MKALTIWQPWTTLIVEELKPFEFRDWAPPRSIVGQRIVLHAAKRPAKARELRDIMAYLTDERGRKDGIKLAAHSLIEKVWRCEIELPFSAGIGSAVMGDPISLPQGRWAWPMLEVEKWPRPIAAKGMQGFWEWRS